MFDVKVSNVYLLISKNWNADLPIGKYADYYDYRKICELFNNNVFILFTRFFKEFVNFTFKFNHSTFSINKKTI